MKIFQNTFIDNTLVRFILVIYLIAYLIDFVGVVLIEWTTGNSSFSEMSAWEIVLRYLFTYIIKLIFLFGAIFITTRIIQRKNVWVKSALIHLLLASILSFYTATLGMYAGKYLFKSGEDPTLTSIWVRGINGLSYNFFVYMAVMSIVYAYYYLKIQKADALKREQLKTQLLDAKLNALQSQLQPHFLFNTLNDISALMDIDKNKSQDALADLSDLLRSTLELSDNRLIAVRDELYILQKYVDIEKIRFGDKLNIEANIETEINNCAIPPLILQPLVENAIKHGYSYDHDLLCIVISMYKKNEEMVIEIENDGRPLPEKEPVLFGTGITNVLERLNTIYGDNYSFGIRNKKTNGCHVVVVQLKIPFSAFQEQELEF